MPTQLQQKHVKWEEAQAEGEEDKEEESKGTHRILRVKCCCEAVFQLDLLFD